jgi:hypothetical protein
VAERLSVAQDVAGSIPAGRPTKFPHIRTAGSTQRTLTFWMGLALYRRHRRECKAGHSEESPAAEYDERKKGFKRCECPIVASGILHSKFRRQTTGQWEASGSWGKADPVPQALPAAEATLIHIRVTDATAANLANARTGASSHRPLSNTRPSPASLMPTPRAGGMVNLEQFTVSDMDRYYGSWSDGIRARAKKLERLIAFVEFFLKRKWITEDLTSDLEAPAGSATPLQRAPFTAEELDRIYAACDALPKGRRNWTGEDAKDFIYLSLYTGLGISDVATFDITKRLNGIDVFLRMHKTKQPRSTYIPTWLVEWLRAREVVNGALIFRCGVTLNAKQLCDIWRKKRLRTIFTAITWRMKTT